MSTHMSRVTPNAIRRAALAPLVMVVAVACLVLSSTPAHAGSRAHDKPNPPSAAPSVNSLNARQCTGTPRTGLRDQCVGAVVPQLSEGGCGFLQRCLYFNRTEQRAIMAGASAGLIYTICAVTAVLGCAAATSLVTAAAQWLLDRGAICPTSRPKLKMRYFPLPSVQGCVA